MSALIHLLSAQSTNNDISQCISSQCTSWSSVRSVLYKLRSQEEKHVTSRNEMCLIEGSTGGGSAHSAGFALSKTIQTIQTGCSDLAVL
ncbi:hypothetical protein DPMN_114185 [Dreissena polymorpha]|uniref:Uncharacterized protein n=1 Tax=Dreissena polymorpha TaxID=45954 RepID=A0A9D4KJM5_DREPO|nr:hypothetical protein DPMN_114185 [Dreissena polymorpha]